MAAANPPRKVIDDLLAGLLELLVHFLNEHLQFRDKHRGVRLWHRTRVKRGELGRCPSTASPRNHECHALTSGGILPVVGAAKAVFTHSFASKPSSEKAEKSCRTRNKRGSGQ